MLTVILIVNKKKQACTSLFFSLPPPPTLFSFLSACVTHDLLVTVCLPVCGVCGCVCMHVQISTWISLFTEVLSTVEHHLRTIKLRATFTFFLSLK